MVSLLEGGRKRSPKTGRFEPEPFSLAPSGELGYFCGLTLGDGYVQKNGRNYNIRFVTTKKEFVDIVAKAMKSVGLNPVFFSYIGTRKFPNGQIRTDPMYGVVTSSKILYEFLLPYKGTKSKPWVVPQFLSTDEAIIGFLRGIYDAEGWACASHCSYEIGLCSKFKESLLEVKHLLRKFGIESSLAGPNHLEYQLRITNWINRKRFANVVGFGLSWKRAKLFETLKLKRYMGTNPRSAVGSINGGKFHGL